MRLLILGGTGQLGTVLVQEALQRGHQLRCLVRTPEKAEGVANRVELVEGAYLGRRDWAGLLAEQEAVVTTIGPPLRGGDRSVLGAYVQTMGELVRALGEHEPRRIVAVGGSGVRLGDEAMETKRRLIRWGLHRYAGDFYREKERELGVLAASDLDWSIVRPPIIRSCRGSFRVSTEKMVGSTVDRAQLAGYLLDVVEGGAMSQQAPFVATG